jgi:hypothetical protein
MKAKIFKNLNKLQGSDFVKCSVVKEIPASYRTIGRKKKRPLKFAKYTKSLPKSKLARVFYMH